MATHKFFAITLMAFLGSCVNAQSTVNSTTPPSDEQAKIAAAMTETTQNQDAKALDLLRQVLVQDPNNAQVNLLAAGAAIEAMQPEIALQYAEKAQQLNSGDWRVHLTLLVAEAGTGKLQERDHERELLRKFHSDGTHPDAARSNGFMLDYFPVKNYRVRAVEYFTPVTDAHFAYRFLIYDQQRRQIWAIALESDDLDQASWRAAHRSLAAAGQREYSLDGYGKSAHTTYRNYSGKPSYDDVKADVVKLLDTPSIAVAIGANQ